MTLCPWPLNSPPPIHSWSNISYPSLSSFSFRCLCIASAIPHSCFLLLSSSSMRYRHGRKFSLRASSSSTSFPLSIDWLLICCSCHWSLIRSVAFFRWRLFAGKLAHPSVFACFVSLLNSSRSFCCFVLSSFLWLVNRSQQLLFSFFSPS